MDPLSAIGAASSVVGVASFGIQLSQALYKFTSQALSAKESLQTILSGVHATACALNQVHGILVEECEYRERKGRAILFSAKAIEDVRGTADKCLIIFWRIEATIANKTTRSNFEEQLNERLKKFNEELSKKKHPDPLNVDTTSISLSRWERLRWPYITPKLEDYNNQLQRLQLNLVLMFSVISLGAHRMKPAQREEDLRALVEAYSRIRRMAAQADLSQISPSFGQQEQSREKRSTNTYQLRLDSPRPIEKNARAEVFPFTPKHNQPRIPSISPRRRPLNNTPLTPIPNVTVERNFENAGNDFSLQRDDKSMEVGLAALRSRKLAVDVGVVSAEGDKIEDVIRRPGNYKSPTTIAAHSADLNENAPEEIKTEHINKMANKDKSLDLDSNKPAQPASINISQPSRAPAKNYAALCNEAGVESNRSKDFETAGLRSNKEMDASEANPLAENLPASVTVRVPLLPVQPGVSQSDSIHPAAESISLDRQSFMVQANSQPTENTRPFGNSKILDTVCPHLPARPPSVLVHESLTTSETDLVIPNCSTVPATQNGASSSRSVENNTRLRPGATSAPDISRKQDMDIQSCSKKLLNTLSLQSHGQSPYRAGSTAIFSRLKSIMYGKQFVTDAFLTAYIIKNGEAYPIPHSGPWKLNRTEIKNLQSQFSDPSWYKIFAFLNTEDMTALQELLSKSGIDGKECKNSIVHLEKVKERQLNFKFWQTVNQVLFTSIRCSPESFSSASSQSESERNQEDIRFESPIELSRKSEVPHPINFTPMTVDVSAKQSPGFAQQPGGPSGSPLLTQTATRSLDISALPQLPATARVGPPPHPPRDATQFGGRLGPPPPPAGVRIPQPRGTTPPAFPPLRIQSTSIQDITPPKLMDEDACLQKLTSYAAFTILDIRPANSKTPAWARADVIQERFSQEDITKQIRKLCEGSQTVAAKKAALSHYQQGQVSVLLDDLATKELDRAFESLLVQLDTTMLPTRPVEGSISENLQEMVTLQVFVSRTPVRGLNPVMLFQNIERMKAEAMRPRPPPGAAGAAPKPTTMSQPTEVRNARNLKDTATPKNSKPRKNALTHHSSERSVGLSRRQYLLYDDSETNSEAEGLDEEGRDIVQQLLSEWTPFSAEGEEAQIYSADKDTSLESPGKEGPEDPEDYERSESRGRSRRRSISR